MCYRRAVSLSSLPGAALVLTLLVVLAALGAVTFERPARAAASFVMTTLAAAGLLHMSGAAEVAGVLLWLLGAGVGLLSLTTILLLNLSPEEAGRRRFSVTRAVALLVVAWLAAALFAVVSDAAASPWSLAGEPAAVATGSLGVVLFERWGIALSLAFAALASSGVAALLLVRRRA